MNGKPTSVCAITTIVTEPVRDRGGLEKDWARAVPTMTGGKTSGTTMESEFRVRPNGDFSRLSAYAAGTEINIVRSTASEAMTRETIRADWFWDLRTIASYHCRVNPTGSMSCQKVEKENITGIRIGTRM
jgi:hypothetical protein